MRALWVCLFSFCTVFVSASAAHAQAFLMRGDTTLYLSRDQILPVWQEEILAYEPGLQAVLVQREPALLSITDQIIPTLSDIPINIFGMRAFAPLLGERFSSFGIGTALMAWTNGQVQDGIRAEPSENLPAPSWVGFHLTDERVPKNTVPGILQFLVLLGLQPADQEGFDIELFFLKHDAMDKVWAVAVCQTNNDNQDTFTAPQICHVLNFYDDYAYGFRVTVRSIFFIDEYWRHLRTISEEYPHLNEGQIEAVRSGAAHIDRFAFRLQHGVMQVGLPYNTVWTLRRGSARPAHWAISVPLEWRQVDNAGDSDQPAGVLGLILQPKILEPELGLAKMTPTSALKFDAMLLMRAGLPDTDNNFPEGDLSPTSPAPAQQVDGFNCSLPKSGDEGKAPLCACAIPATQGQMSVTLTYRPTKGSAMEHMTCPKAKQLVELLLENLAVE